MTMLDFKKDLKELYSPSAKRTVIVDVPEMSFLMVDGRGDPNTSREYAEALEALYSLSYTLKFMVKNGPDSQDYPVPPSEGLWWSDNMNDFMTGNKSAWQWTMMIMQPSPVTAELVERARVEVAKKKVLPALAKVRFERFAEGKCAQIMYIGPYAAEQSTIEALHVFIKEHGYKPVGKHHEIYIGDPRRSAPENLHTIIRQPIAVA